MKTGLDQYMYIFKDAVEYSDEQWDILCHNERVYAQIFMFLYCEMAERGLIK